MSKKRLKKELQTVRRQRDRWRKEAEHAQAENEELREALAAREEVR